MTTQTKKPKNKRSVFRFNAQVQTYYDVLNLPETASQPEIKRAYYAALKTVSQERDPDKFEKLKQAYETLNNMQKRLAYDSMNEMSSLELLLYDSASAMLAEGSSGNAVKKFQELEKLVPGNLAVMRQLAAAYDERGYNKKAIAQYEKILGLYEQDMLSWSNYTDYLMNNFEYGKAEHAIKKAVEINEKYGLANADVLMNAVNFFIEDDIGYTRHCFDELRKCDMSDIMTYKNPEMYIVNLILAKRTGDFYDDALYYGRNVKPLDYEYVKIEKILLYKEIKELIESGNFDEVFPELFEVLIDANERFKVPDERDMAISSLLEKLNPGKNKARKKMHLLCVQSNILTGDTQLMRKQIRMINASYPKLYALHKDFFGKFLIERNEQRMCEANFSEFKALYDKNPSLRNEFGDPDDADETDGTDETDESGDRISEVKHTPVRVEQKIGRNDPCPCGSGKKYKKCCGTAV